MWVETVLRYVQTNTHGSSKHIGVCASGYSIYSSYIAMTYFGLVGRWVPPGTTWHHCCQSLLNAYARLDARAQCVLYCCPRSPHRADDRRRTRRCNGDHRQWVITSSHRTGCPNLIFLLRRGGGFARTLDIAIPPLVCDNESDAEDSTERMATLERKNSFHRHHHGHHCSSFHISLSFFLNET